MEKVLLTPKLSMIFLSTEAILNKELEKRSLILLYMDQSIEVVHFMT